MLVALEVGVFEPTHADAVTLWEVTGKLWGEWPKPLPSDVVLWGLFGRSPLDAVSPVASLLIVISLSLYGMSYVSYQEMLVRGCVCGGGW
jgi:hypothetical protein